MPQSRSFRSSSWASLTIRRCARPVQHPLYSHFQAHRGPHQAPPPALLHYKCHNAGVTPCTTKCNPYFDQHCYQSCCSGCRLTRRRLASHPARIRRLSGLPWCVFDATTAWLA
jgi:hypothetical protein